MPPSEDPRNVEQTQAALSSGIEACRAVLRNYRRLIADESGEVPVHRPADNDDGRSTDDLT